MKFSTTLKRTWSSVLRKLSHKRGDTAGKQVVLKHEKIQSNSSSSSEAEMPISFVVYSGAHTADAFGPLPYSPIYRSTDSESLPELSSSSSSSASSMLSPNAGLFHMNQDDVGFDVWLPAQGILGPVCVPCPAVLSWNELVFLFADKAQRSEEDIAFFNANYIGLVSNEEDYEAWLEWSRENEHSSNRDLWLV